MASDTRHARLVEKAAAALKAAFEDYNASFSDITRRARRRFEQSDRRGMQRDVIARLELYDRSADRAISQLEAHLSERLFSRSLWRDIRRIYGELIDIEIDAELYKTFFNTVTRRLFKTRGVDPAIEFVALDIIPTDRISHPVARRTHSVSGRLDRVFLEILADQAFRQPWADLTADSLALADRLRQAFLERGEDQVVALELLDVVFYREGRAYLIGRAFGAGSFLPCVIALSCRDGLIRAEALLTQRQQVSILFGYTFSYFLADLQTVGDTVVFLRTLLPDKPLDELYTVLGRAKQGKTERFRRIFRHIETCPEDRLVEADGQRGLVMLVFTLPGVPVVFKLIRDRFAPVKKFGRRQVLDRYRLVFRHDRVGRLIDAQEFRDLRFPLDRVSEALLTELQAECGKIIEVDGDSLVVRHCYVERRLRPLDLYLKENDGPAAELAVLDYAQALKDLARSNIFAGDLLPKNFGVTRAGRVIFYDYDELRLMSECRFRKLPPSRDDLFEFSDEPWFHIGDNDVFPEQFPRFMGLSQGHLDLLASAHGELFDPAWWQEVQGRLADGGTLDVPPFGPEAGLDQAGGAVGGGDP